MHSLLSHPHPPTPPIDVSSHSRSGSTQNSQLPILPVVAPNGSAVALPHERRSSVSFSIAPVLINQLKGGSIFLKHGSRGSPHYRYVWLSSDSKFLHWGDLKTRRVHGSIQCDSMISVVRGHASQLFMQRAPKNCNPNFCFSIQSTARTLDLECSNEQERELWAKAFDYLIMAVKGKLPHPIGALTPDNEKMENGGQPSLVEALEILSSNYEANLAATTMTTLPATLSEIQEDAPTPNHGRSRSSTLSGKGLNLPNQQINNLYGWLDEAQVRIERLEKENELYKDDNRKLMISYAKKMIKLQETIDNLTHENHELKEKLGKSSSNSMK